MKIISLFQTQIIRYEGEWKNNKRDGTGVMTYASGDRYQGEFKDGIKHGQGVYVFANGSSNPSHSPAKVITCVVSGWRPPQWMLNDTRLHTKCTIRTLCKNSS